MQSQPAVREVTLSQPKGQAGDGVPDIRSLSFTFCFSSPSFPRTGREGLDQGRGHKAAPRVLQSCCSPGKVKVSPVPIPHPQPHAGSYGQGAQERDPMDPSEPKSSLPGGRTKRCGGWFRLCSGMEPRERGGWEPVCKPLVPAAGSDPVRGSGTVQIFMRSPKLQPGGGKKRRYGGRKLGHPFCLAWGNEVG